MGEQIDDVECSGFDPCEGFVQTCAARGLGRVVNADFYSYFSSRDDGITQFDGIFSLAALFHIPRAELAPTLRRFREHLVPSSGILLVSLPVGDTDAVDPDGRWIHSMPAELQIDLLGNVGFEVLHQENVSIYNGKHWLVTVSRRID